MNGNKAWHAGNDGAGSGLDADLIRGMDPGRFVFGDNSRATTKFTGNLDDIQKSGFYYAATGHLLNPNSVSVRKQAYVTVEDAEYPVGDPWRRAYENSIIGRSQVQDDVPELYRTAIFSVWGNEPTVTERTE